MFLSLQSLLEPVKNDGEHRHPDERLDYAYDEIRERYFGIITKDNDDRDAQYNHEYVFSSEFFVDEFVDDWDDYHGRPRPDDQ